MLRERAVEAYRMWRAKRDAEEREKAERWAEKGLRLFQERFRLKPDKVKPVHERLAFFEADGLVLAFFYWRQPKFALAKTCAKCGRLVYDWHQDLRNLIELGRALEENKLPEICGECRRREEPSLEELLVRLLSRLGVCFDE